jgi:hypothetical protein
MALWAAFGRDALSGARGRRIAAAEAIEWKRMTGSADVESCEFLVLWQLGPRKPETVEAYYHILERVPVPRFSQIRVCPQLITGLDIRFRLGTCQNNHGDRLQVGVCLDPGQNFAAVQFWQI